MGGISLVLQLQLGIGWIKDGWRLIGDDGCVVFGFLRMFQTLERQ